MAQERIHIVPHEQGWGVKREGKADAESVHATQKEAIESGRDLAERVDADMVVHRSDGTFRKVYSIGSEEGNGNMADKANGRDSNRVEANDVLSVGTRISWGATLAGAAVAVAIAVTLGTLATAIGISAFNRGEGNGPYIYAAIASIVTLLAALFVGGFVTSRITAGEDKTEALTYGVVLWGVVFVAVTALSASGANIGLNALMLGTSPQVTAPPDLYQGLDLSQTEIATLDERLTWNVDPQLAAWMTFAGIVLSIGAAIGGSLMGAGPTLVLQQLRGRRAVVTSRGTLQEARS